MPKTWSRKVEKKPTEKQMELTLISLLGLTDRWEYPDFKEVYRKTGLRSFSMELLYVSDMLFVAALIVWVYILIES